MVIGGGSGRAFWNTFPKIEERREEGAARRAPARLRQPLLRIINFQPGFICIREIRTLCILWINWSWLPQEFALSEYAELLESRLVFSSLLCPITRGKERGTFRHSEASSFCTLRISSDGESWLKLKWLIVKVEIALIFVCIFITYFFLNS